MTIQLSELIKTGLQNKPPRVILYGPHGIGKSTFGSHAPDPIFLPTEDGLTNIDVPHFPLPKTLDEAWTYLGMLLKEDHGYKTLVIDTVDWLEALIWTKVCEDGQVKNIEDFGYGKGYIKALDHWNYLIKGLGRLRDEKKMAVVLLAHSEVKPYNPPDADPYDRYQIKVHKHGQAKIEEWADAVLFANFQVFVKGSQKDKKGNAKPGKAVGGDRIIYTQPNPAWRAKNRYDLPEQMPFDFKELLNKIRGE